MRLIKTKPRYRCDYCRHVCAGESKMAKHEQICWRNPLRHCELCDDTGFTYEDINGDGSLVHKEPCYYCSQFDATKVPPVGQASERTLNPAKASSEALTRDSIREEQ